MDQLMHDCENVEEVEKLENLCKDMPLKMAGMDGDTRGIEDHWEVLDERLFK